MSRSAKYGTCLFLVLNFLINLFIHLSQDNVSVWKKNQNQTVGEQQIYTS